MSLQFGFELEGFLLDKDKNVICPPLETLRNWSSYQDGFPGLIEIRTNGGNNLYEAYYDLMRRVTEFREKISKYNFTVSFNKTETVFTGQQMAFLRKNYHFTKRQVDIKNIYGKEQRRLGNRTLASLQINISNETREKRSENVYDKDNRLVKTITYPSSSGLLDIPTIVRGLDKAFAGHIKESNRQPGLYALKDGYTRLEYRSLPNYSFSESPDGVAKFLQTLKKITETEQ